MDPLDNDNGSRQPQEQLGGFGLLCACCTSTRGGTTSCISKYGIAPLSDSIQTQSHDTTTTTPPPPPTIVLEKCKGENHFTHYNYRVTTPREMPPF
jgi:hypothetical protein